MDQSHVKIAKVWLHKSTIDEITQETIDKLIAYCYTAIGKLTADTHKTQRTIDCTSNPHAKTIQIAIHQPQKLQLEAVIKELAELEHSSDTDAPDVELMEHSTEGATVPQVSNFPLAGSKSAFKEVRPKKCKINDFSFERNKISHLKHPNPK